ncbi:MAG: hypothetical protein JKY44_04495 [Flavobacteriaceae bacterium]|nr:hypothetical protein [Flavobacteriaceae bacterium]
MKQTYAFIIAVLIITVIHSCTTVKIASNKADKYTKKLNKVFVLSQSEAKAQRITNTFSKKLMNEFKKHGVEGRFDSKNALSLKTDSEYFNKVKIFNPKQLMIIKQTAINYRTPTIINAISFEIQILEYASNNVIWKGELDVYGQVGIESSIEKSLRKLIKQLVKDKLL